MATKPDPRTDDKVSNASRKGSENEANTTTVSAPTCYKTGTKKQNSRNLPAWEGSGRVHVE